MPSVAAEAPLVVVVGATATGKTCLATALAAHLEGEMVNADSRQAFRDLAVGVNKPTPVECRGVPCHGLDWRGLGEPFTVADFVERAHRACDEIASRGRVAVVVGGTGLYVRALVDGFDFGGVAPGPEPRGAVQGGSAAVRAGALLRQRAPDLAARVDLRNPRRVARALELADAGARPGRGGRSRPALWVGIRVASDRLRRRIEERTARLVGPAWRQEVDDLLGRGIPEATLAAAAIGYREVLQWRAGEITLDEARARVARRTWRYARAQATWFRREPRIRWLEDDEMVAMLHQAVASLGLTPPGTR